MYASHCKASVFRGYVEHKQWMQWKNWQSPCPFSKNGIVLSLSCWIHALAERMRMSSLYPYVSQLTASSFILLENPLKVVPLIHSNLTPVKFSHSPFCLFLFSSYSSCPLCRVLHQISFTNITIIFYFYISAATPRRVQCVWPDAQFCPERHRQSSFLQ